MQNSEFRQRCLEELAISLLIGGTVAGITAAMLPFEHLIEAVAYSLVMTLLCTFACWEVIDCVEAVIDRFKRDYV